MKKGIVMEVQPDTIIMMTPEGEFVKTRKQPSVHYEIGEERTFFPHTYEESSTSILGRLKQKLHIKPVLSGAAALLMLLFILIPAFNDPEVYAYVSVDINPSFEMSIDQDQEVMDIKPFNAEAEEILKQMREWKGKSIIDVTDEIIDLSSKNGYMDELKKVTLTTVFTDEADSKDKSSVEDEIKQLTNEKLDEGTAAISLIDSDSEVRAEAIAAGMTAGQLLMKKEKAQKEQKEQLSSEQAADSPIPPENPKKSTKESVDVEPERKHKIETEEKPKELPAATDKRPEHVKEKLAEKSNRSNSNANENRSSNGSDKKQEKGNNGNGNGKGHNPGADNKKDDKGKDRGKGNNQAKPQEHPKKNNGKNKGKEENRQSNMSGNDKGRGNGN
jgi:hypothetical protein